MTGDGREGEGARPQPLCSLSKVLTYECELEVAARIGEGTAMSGLRACTSSLSAITFAREREAGGLIAKIDGSDADA